MKEVHEYVTEAQGAFDQGEYHQALNTLTDGFIKEVDHIALYHLTISTLEKLEAREELALFREAVENFQDADPFFNLGYHFIDVGHYRLATPFLEKAHIIDPDDSNIVYELSIAYLNQFQPADALAVLENKDADSDFWFLFQVYHCKLLNGRTDGVNEFIRDIRALAETRNEDEIWDEVLPVLDILEERVRRLGTVDDIPVHIRPWHFVQYGSSVLDFFEADNDEYVAGGRYVALWGSVDSIRLVLEKLKIMLESIDRYPKIVRSTPDRNSEIIGRAAAKVFGLPFEILNAENVNHKHALVIAADAADFIDFSDLIEVQQQQTVFALNLNWLSDFMFTPDVVGHLTQSYTLPWEGGGLVFEPETGKVKETEPDNRPEEELALDIVNAEYEMPDEFIDTLNFYRARRSYLKGGIRGGERRLVFRIESPVPGAYFTS